MKKSPVAITIRSFDTSGELRQKIEDDFSIIYINTSGARLSEDELIQAVKNAEYVIAGTEHFSKRVLESAKKLRAISRVGVGIDAIDTIAAARLNITILNTPEAPVIAVTEHALALLLAILKRIPAYNSRVRQGDQSIQPGLLLSGKTVGIAGLGRIGFRFASLLSQMGCHIRYYDPYLKVPVPENWRSSSSLEELVGTSDIVSLHAAPKSDGTPIIDASTLRKARPGLILINTARGSLIDESALEQAIQDGIISAAGLDVFSKEPYTGTLLKYPQIIITPHVASNTLESRRQMEYEAVENIIRVKRGSTL
ncbi:MAG: NAD(P)-dependent oxidoreductase [Methanoregula sp.]|jgi:D-3-phosphoglycerate dehydrogenase|uniref:NAD(P)-dependent oxidoreductase n=1 Tax=Methanoregula sp. TaxID=2052170 RepID=UPI003D1360B4